MGSSGVPDLSEVLLAIQLGINNMREEQRQSAGKIETVINVNTEIR